MQRGFLDQPPGGAPLLCFRTVLGFLGDSWPCWSFGVALEPNPVPPRSGGGSWSGLQLIKRRLSPVSRCASCADLFSSSFTFRGTNATAPLKLRLSCKYLLCQRNFRNILHVFFFFFWFFYIYIFIVQDWIPASFRLRCKDFPASIL